MDAKEAAVGTTEPATKTATTEPSPPQFAVGLPLFLEMALGEQNVRLQTCVMGWNNEASVLIAAAPHVDEASLPIRPNTSCVVRYLFEGTVYGFVTQLLRKQADPLPLWFFEYPKAVEVKNLRKHPRLRVLLPVRNDDGAEWSIVDLSKEGAKLVVNRDLVVGQEITLSFVLPNGAMINELKAEVMRTQKSAVENAVGVRFIAGKYNKTASIEKYVDRYFASNKTV